MVKRHSNGTRTFNELDRKGKASSVSASLIILEKAIQNRVRTSPNPEETRRKCIGQVARLLGRL